LFARAIASHGRAHRKITRNGTLALAMCLLVF
jgi:hypothetical protein